LISTIFGICPSLYCLHEEGNCKGRFVDSFFTLGTGGSKEIRAAL
jgi:hypothetical protein